MKSLAVLVVLSFALTVSALAPLPALPARGEYVPDEYIVVLRPGLSIEARNEHVKELQSDFSLSQGVNQVIKTYHIDSFIGFHAKLSQDMLARERANPDVHYIEYNGIARASQSCNVQTGATWGLDRINEVDIKLDGHYNYGADGAGVDAYIIDTGIQTTHEEFEDRASWGLDVFGEPTPVDCNGHGTHVAGTVGGKVYGVAKKANLIAVKVLNCGGSGTWDGVIEGIDWVAAQGKSTRAATGKRSVANMSLGGGYNKAVDDAVEAAVAAGIPFAIAAGNSDWDACTSSPASAPNAITVGATTVVDKGAATQEDQRAYFSNYGKCVDIFAPGQLITAAWIGSNTATNTISGTSMASPHVAGAVAVLLSANPALNPAQVTEALNGSSTKGVIDLACTASEVNCQASPNALLYSHCSE